MAYLDDNPPRTAQGRPRRARPSGGVVVHTAESGIDLTPPDNRSENVARFIVGRSDPGSYHTLFDSDSTLVLWDFVPMEAFHDGTGTNRFSTGMSFATNAALWGQNPAWDEGALTQAARWLAKTYIPAMAARSIDVRLERTTVDKFRNGDPAFISHGELDPGRRSDPGPAFPWQRLFDLTREMQGSKPDTKPKPKPPTIGDEMPYAFGKYIRDKTNTAYGFFPGGKIRAMGPAEFEFYRREVKPPMLVTKQEAEWKRWKKAAARP